MKEKLLFVCLTCQMTDAIHIEGNETVKEVIALMASEHKKSMPRCKSEGKYRLVLKDGEAQQKRAADSMKAEAICQPKKIIARYRCPRRAANADRWAALAQRESE